MSTSKKTSAKQEVRVPVTPAEDLPERPSSRPTGTLEMVPLNRIKPSFEDFSFRGMEAFTEVELREVMESLKLHGIINPLVGVRLPKGLIRPLDGHRRYKCLETLAKQGVAGFSTDMPVPVIVYDQNLSRMDQLSLGATSNISRQNLPPEARYRIERKLHEAGATYAYIARVLNISETSVARDISLVTDPVLMSFVEEGVAPASYLSAIRQAAEKKGRLEDVYKALKTFKAWADRKIKHEMQRRTDAGLKLLSEAEQRPRRYLTDIQKTAWLDALAAGKPLVLENFRFSAAVSEDGTLTIKGVTAKLHAMERSQVLTMARRCGELAMDLVERAKRAPAKQDLEARSKRRHRFLELLGIDDEEETFDPELEAKFSEAEPEASDEDLEEHEDDSDLDDDHDEKQSDSDLDDEEGESEEDEEEEGESEEEDEE